MDPQEFKKLTQKKRNEFLSNDMAERIIRVEQRVSAKFGSLLYYTNTEYYKSLTPAQKASFDKYLKNKNKKKSLIGLIFLIPIVFIFLLNVSFTGNVVNNNLGDYNLLNYVLAGFILISFLIFIIFIMYKIKRNKKIEGYFKIIDDFLEKE